MTPRVRPLSALTHWPPMYICLRDFVAVAVAMRNSPSWISGSMVMGQSKEKPGGPQVAAGCEGSLRTAIVRILEAESARNENPLSAMRPGLHFAHVRPIPAQ